MNTLSQKYNLNLRITTEPVTAGADAVQLRNHLQLQNLYPNLARLDPFPLFSFPKRWESFPDEQIKIINLDTKQNKKFSMTSLQLPFVSGTATYSPPRIFL